jgi:hypothetical protein
MSRGGRVTGRPGRRSARLAAVFLVLATLSGCSVGAVEVPRSSHKPSKPSKPSTSAPEPAPAADVSGPDEATTVLDAAPGADAAIAVSRVLFRSAPAVVVATEADRAGIAEAAELAPRIGAPVLLVPRRDGPQRTALRQELDRLSPGTVLAMGVNAADSARTAAGGVPVRLVGADDRAGAPDVPAAKPRPVKLTLLVNRSRDDTAAAATARAAGAEVVAVSGGDPRADAKAIAALRSAPTKTVVALGREFQPAQRLRDRLAVATRGAQLPGGGQVVLAGRRIVCLYGHPGARSLGVLGEQGIDASIARAKRMAGAYRPYSDVPVVPAFEIIATVAQGAPGPDGDFSAESSVGELRPWVDEARKAGLYVVLDLQPGRSDLLKQARRYEPLLRLPHVGLAVDPEWKLGPRQRPLGQIGGIEAAELNRTSAWLASLAAAHTLPQKLFVVHQFRLSMIRHEAALNTAHDELSVLIHMDGQGSTGQKNATWRSVVGARPRNLPLGWKNFYDEDHPMLTPRQTMAKRPAPAMISYQ